MKKHGPPSLDRMPEAKQRRLHELLDKNSDGTITPKEKTKLEQLVAEAEQLMATNARRLAEFSKSERLRAPAEAVPVTVWVQPEHAER